MNHYNPKRLDRTMRNLYQEFREYAEDWSPEDYSVGTCEYKMELLDAMIWFMAGLGDMVEGETHQVVVMIDKIKRGEEI